MNNTILEKQIAGLETKRSSLQGRLAELETVPAETAAVARQRREIVDELTEVDRQRSILRGRLDDERAASTRAEDDRRAREQSVKRSEIATAILQHICKFDAAARAQVEALNAIDAGFGELRRHGMAPESCRRPTRPIVTRALHAAGLRDRANLASLPNASHRTLEAQLAPDLQQFLPVAAKVA